MRCHRLAPLVLAALCGAAPAAAQSRGAAPAPPSGGAAAQQRAEDVERERAFVEAMRREDPAAADRYVALRDARNQAMAEMRKIEAQYNGAGPGLQGVFARSLIQARKKYAEASIALIDFFDARDREILGKYQEEIGRINAVLEDRKKTRAELEKLLAP